MRFRHHAGIDRLRDISLFAAIKITPADHPKALPPRDGTWLKHRMRVALLGERAHE